MKTLTKILLASCIPAVSMSRMPIPVVADGGDGTPPPPAPFAFPDTLDSLDGVPERARGLYTEKDGKFVYTDTGALRNSLTNARNERDAAKRDAATAAALKALGKTPEEIQALIDAAAAAAEEEHTKKGNWEALKKQMEDNHNAALSEKDKKIAKLQGSLEKALIHDSARAALSDEEVGGNPLFLLPAIDGRVKLEETDNGFKTVVLREDGTPQLNADNNPATLKDLFLEFKAKPDWANAFKGSGQSGGGAPNQQKSGGGAPNGKKRSEMSNSEKTAFIKEFGSEKYLALPT